VPCHEARWVRGSVPLMTSTSTPGGSRLSSEPRSARDPLEIGDERRRVATIETGPRKQRYLVATPNRVLVRVPDPWWRLPDDRGLEADDDRRSCDSPQLRLAEERLRTPAKPVVPLRTDACLGGRDARALRGSSSTTRLAGSRGATAVD
jgi:hypothetical protein